MQPQFAPALPNFWVRWQRVAALQTRKKSLVLSSQCISAVITGTPGNDPLAPKRSLYKL